MLVELIVAYLSYIKDPHAFVRRILNGQQLAGLDSSRSSKKKYVMRDAHM